MSYYNTTTQRKYTTLPASYAGVSHYPMATHRHTSDGFYPLVEFVTPDGYSKIAGTQTYTLDGDVVRENWQVQTDAEQEAATQAAKPLALKQAENKFFDLCFAIFGDRTKRGFDELNTAIEAMTATDPSTATALAIRLLAVDAECKREGGNQWWDTAAYHEEVE